MEPTYTYVKGKGWVAQIPRTPLNHLQAVCGNCGIRGGKHQAAKPHHCPVSKDSWNEYRETIFL